MLRRSFNMKIQKVFFYYYYFKNATFFCLPYKICGVRISKLTTAVASTKSYTPRYVNKIETINKIKIIPSIYKKNILFHENIRIITYAVLQNCVFYV